MKRPWAQRLYELRVQNNLSQQAVADILHCSQAAYGLYELDRRLIPLDKLIVLADYYLTGRTDRPGWTETKGTPYEKQ